MEADDTATVEPRACADNSDFPGGILFTLMDVEKISDEEFAGRFNERTRSRLHISGKELITSIDDHQ